MKKEPKKNKNRSRTILPKRVNFESLFFIVVFLGLVCTIIWSESISLFFVVGRTNGLAPLLTPTLPAVLPTPLPEELIRSGEQTNGVILGAIFIILTVIIGSAAILIRDRE